MHNILPDASDRSFGVDLCNVKQEERKKLERLYG